jgi:hypothetical protein
MECVRTGGVGGRLVPRGGCKASPALSADLLPDRRPASKWRLVEDPRDASLIDVLPIDASGKHVARHTPHQNHTTIEPAR